MLQSALTCVYVKLQVKSTLKIESTKILGFLFSIPGCLSDHGVVILDGPAHCGASKNFRVIILLEHILHKHI